MAPGSDRLRSAFAPVLRRRGWERVSFVFFVLGVACVPGTGVANVGLGLTLVSTIVWRARAARSGEDFLKPFRRTSPLHAPIASFVLWSILSCFFSTLPSRSLLEIKGFGTFLLVPFTIALLVDEDDVHFVLDLWRLTAFYLVVRGLLEYVGGKDNVNARLTGGLSIYMTYAGLLMALVLMLYGRGLTRLGRRAAGLFDLAVAVGGTVAVGLTFTRNTYLGLFVGALALFALSRPRLLVIVPVAAVLLFLLMPKDVQVRALSGFDSSDPTARDRLRMWRSGELMIREHPLFGVGPGRVKELYPAYRQPGFVLPNAGHLHDNVIMIAAETGIPSALIYLWFVAALFVHAVRKHRMLLSGVHRSVIRGSVAAMAALFVAGFFEYNFGDVEVLMATLVLASMPFCLGRNGGGAAATIPTS